MRMLNGKILEIDYGALDGVCLCRQIVAPRVNDATGRTNWWVVPSEAQKISGLIADMM